MEYEILSPLADKDAIVRGLNPRIADLEHKTIGMFYYFFDSHVAILREIEKQLKEKFPTLTFSYYQYTVETSEIEHDETHRDSFQKWVEGVDTVISVYGNIPSPTLYIAYNTAYIERLGKPAIILTGQAGANMARSGVSAKGFPELRVLVVDLPHIGFGDSDRIQHLFVPGVTKSLDQITEALTKPLTPKETSPAEGVQQPPGSSTKAVSRMSTASSTRMAGHTACRSYRRPKKRSERWWRRRTCRPIMSSRCCRPC